MTQSATKRHQLNSPSSSTEELSAIANDIRAPIRQIEEKCELLLQELDAADRNLAVHAIRSAVGTLRLVLEYLDDRPAQQFAAAVKSAATDSAATEALTTHAVLRLLAARLAFAADQHDVEFKLEADIDLPALSESDVELTKRALMRVVEYLIRVVGSGGSVHLHCRQPDSKQALALEIELNPQGDVAALCMGVGSIADLRALIDDEGCFDDAAACLGGKWRVQHGGDNSLKLSLDYAEVPIVVNTHPIAPETGEILAMEESLVQVEPIAHRFDFGRSSDAIAHLEDRSHVQPDTQELESSIENLAPSDQVTLAPSGDGILGSSIEQLDELPKVLIVDDNTISQRLLLRMLDAGEFNSTIEPDAGALLGRLASQSFSAILIDCRVMGFDCYKLAAEVRALEKKLGRKPARMIGMSANLERDSFERCREAGMDSFVSKPISRTVLVQAIKGDKK